MENHQPPRKTLGDYATQQGPWRNANTALSSNKALEMKPAFLNLITANQFMGLEHEDPYSHLNTFFELCDLMGVKEDENEGVYIRLFPFSLGGRAKVWLQTLVGHESTSWKDIEGRFIGKFFPPSR